MKTFIALLRGINVGGHKKFIKAEQIKMLEQLGYPNAQVYLHTGNWIFTSEEKADIISERISEAILEAYGWEVPVLVLEASEFECIFKACPFSPEIKEKSYFTLLKNKPHPDQVAVLAAYNFPNEEYHITDRCVYFYPALGAHKAKMSNNWFENKLKVTATSRNYKTMAKLLALVKA